MYFTPEKLEELSKEIRTVPVDGEGNSLEVGYTDMFVRDTVTKLIADIKEKNEYIATIVNSYHHVLTYGLTQEGVRLVNGLPQAIVSTEIPQPKESV